MKKAFITLLVAFIALAEASAQYQSSVAGATKGTVTLRSTGYGKKAAIAATDAELSAIKTLLFAGAQGTPHSIPLIQESKEATEEKYKNFFDDFYNNTYKNFIESSVIVVPYGKNALKQKCITLDVCIRVAQLRPYLESNGIIRKFGF